ncbi:hypothetical protein BDV93DRAFT_559250, partial [Ceratobasidium sp. AG-I]
MDDIFRPKVVVVTLYEYECHLPDKPLSLFARMFKRSSSYRSQIKMAHRFVVQNYRAGDIVMLRCVLGGEGMDGPKYAAIRQLAAALDTGTAIGAPRRKLPSGPIPIKFAASEVPASQPVYWSVVDRALSDFPSTVENLLCMHLQEAYVVQRGSSGWMIRKEPLINSNLSTPVRASLQPIRTLEAYATPILSHLISQIVMASHSASLAKRPHSPSTSNSPPAKRRAHSPEEGEVDDGKLVVPPSACSRSSSPYANGGESPSRTGSTSPSQSHAEAGLTKNSKHAFPFASTANNGKSQSSPSGDRDRDRNRGDFYRPSSPRHRSGNHNHSHNAARHAPGYDSYRPGVDADSYRPSYRRSRSRSGSRSRPDSASPVARRHRLPPRPASPPPQPPLHSSYSATSYERSSGGGYERANSGGHDRFNGGTYDRNSSGDRWAASQSRWDGPNNSSNSNGRGRTRNPYADSGPSTRGTTPNPGTAGGLRPLDTPGAPLGPERVGTGMDMNRGGDEIGEDGETGSKEEGEEQDNVGPRDGKADSWEPRPDRGRDGGRSWEREREKGRDDSRGWTGGRGWDDSRGRTQDRERGRNLERGQPPPPPPPPSNGNTLPPPAGDALPPQLNGSAPPPPPLPVDPKIEEALNDTIARVMREADEADAKRKE